MVMVENDTPIIPGRSCGSCTLCCKLLKIDALNKPADQWCQHCHIGHGCRIYADKPEECSRFYCGYLTNPELNERWRPDHSKIVLVAELDGGRLSAYVDPQRPDAWRNDPYYATLNDLAHRAAPYRGQVMVCIGRRMYMIFPDRDVDLGVVGYDELVVTGERNTPFGVRLEAFKIHRDDPRAQGVVIGGMPPPGRAGG